MKRIAVFLILFLLLPNLALSEEVWTLNDALSAINNAPELKLLQAQLDSAESKLKQVQSLFTTPRLTGNIGYSRGESTETYSGNTITTIIDQPSATLSLTYNLSEDSPAGTSLLSARLAYYKAKNNYINGLRSLKLKITKQFFDALFAQRQLGIAEKSLALAEKHLKIAQDQFSKRAITENSLMDAQLALKSSQLSYESAKNSLKIALLTLFNTLGIPYRDIVLREEVSYKDVEFSLEELIKEAMENNLDIKNTQYSLIEAERNHKDATKSNITLGLSGTYSVNGQSLKIGIDNQNYQLSLSYSFPLKGSSGSSSPDWAIAFTVSAPIIDGGSRNESIKQATLSLEQAKINLENTKKTVELTVRQYYNTVMQAMANIEKAQLNLQQKELLVKNQEIRLGLGLITQLDLESARIQREQALLELDKAIVDYNIALMQLNIILGKE
ncbi:MAG: TolC family protein [bacterium]|nr:TolC family protein [bacterium]